MLDRLAAAVQEGGGVPVRAQGLAALEGPQVPHRLVVFAWDGEPEAARQLGAKLRPSAQLVALIPPRPLSHQMLLFGEQHCNHIFTCDDAGLLMLQRTVAKFVSGDLFGIEKYVPPGTEIHLCRLRDYAGRQKALDEILAFADKAGVRRQVRAAVAQVCEELLMNALYDAPVGQDGEPLFAEVGTKERLGQRSPRPVSIRYAAADTRLLVGVRDRFGRLTKDVILRYINKCLRSPGGPDGGQGPGEKPIEKIDQIDRKTYGAGLGLYLIANAASQYVVNIAPGMATEVICAFERGARQPLRALSVFVYPGAPGQAQPVL